MNTLPEGEQIGPIDCLQDYNNIFVKVNKWGAFKLSDINRNDTG